MPSRDVYRTGAYGCATKVGSSEDATSYKSTKAAETFHAALLDPNATTIRRKSGTKWPKRQHVLIYNSEFACVRFSDVTPEMDLITNEKTITSPSQKVHVWRPRFNARATFHAQTSYPYPVAENLPSPPPVTTSQHRKSFRSADIEGRRRHNKDRDW